MDRKIMAAASALLVLAACGKAGEPAKPASGDAPAQESAAAAKPGLFGSPQKDCEAPAKRPSQTREEAAKAVDGCLAVLAKNADEEGESAWNSAQLAAAEKGDATALVLSALAALAHPDGKLRNADGWERVQALQRLHAAAKAGYALEIYELGKRWGKDRRRAETAEEQNAMYLGEDLFLIAAMNGIYPAMLERGRLEIYFGLRDEKSFNGESSRQHFYDAAKWLKTVQEKGSPKDRQAAAILLKEIGY